MFVLNIILYFEKIFKFSLQLKFTLKKLNVLQFLRATAHCLRLG